MNDNREILPFDQESLIHRARKLADDVVQENSEGIYDGLNEEKLAVLERVFENDARVKISRVTTDRGFGLLFVPKPPQREQATSMPQDSRGSANQSHAPVSVEEALRAITEVREPIQEAPFSDSPNRFWSGMGLDALIMSNSAHDGRPEEIARQVYHRLSARFIGSLAHGLQQAALRRGLFSASLSALFVCASPILIPVFMTSPDLGKVLSFVVLVAWLGTPIALFLYAKGVWTNAPGQMRSLPIAKIKEEAMGAVQRCFVRGVPPNAPADLLDLWRHSWYTNEGRPVSSEIVDTDATSLVALETARGWRSCYQSLILTAGLSLLCPPIVLLAGVLFALRGGGGTSPGVIRSQELDRRKSVEGSMLVAAGGIEWAKHQELARVQQVAEAMKDQTPIFRLGVASGILAGRGDSYAPSAGLRFDLSLRDLQNHLLVVGGTGSGKTSGVLRPLAYQIAEQKGVGLVVMDGKAALPSELRTLPGMQIVDPAETRFSLVAGLSPPELVDTLVDVLSSGNEAEPFFRESAAALLRRAAVIAKHVGGEWWTLQGIAQLASSPEALDTAKRFIKVEHLERDPMLEEAVFFFTSEWPALDQRPRSSILAHAMSWITTITAQPDLFGWAQTKSDEDSFDLMSPLKGGRLGFLIPSHRYGRAGAAVTALLKARLYSGLKARAENGLREGETPVVFLIDEVQEVATKDDATMLSIGRSLGLAMVGSTQTVEGVSDKLGETAAAKWLAVYGNAIGLTGRSSATDEFMAKRAGSVWKAAAITVPGMSVKDSIISSVFSGSVAASRKQETMREFATAAPSPLTPFQEKSRQAAQHKSFVNPDPRYQREPDEGLSSSVHPVPIVVAEELPTLLAEPNLALAVTTRARVPRRDVIKLSPRF